MTETETDRIVARLRAREAELSPDADNSRWSGKITALMESIANTPAGLATLVAEFAGTHNPEFANSIAFILAGEANDAARAPTVAPHVITAMCRIDVPSPWPRLNLGTAVQRLLMFRALPPELGRPVPGLARLLLDGLNSGNALVQAVAGIVYNDLHYSRSDDALTADDRALIEPKLLACIDSPNRELAGEARELLARRA